MCRYSALGWLRYSWLYNNKLISEQKYRCLKVYWEKCLHISKKIKYTYLLFIHIYRISYTQCHISYICVFNYICVYMCLKHAYYTHISTYIQYIYIYIYIYIGPLKCSCDIRTVCLVMKYKLETNFTIRWVCNTIKRILSELSEVVRFEIE